MKKLIAAFFLTAVCGMMNAKTYGIFTGVSNYSGSDHDLAQSSKDAKAMSKLYSDKGASVTLLTSKYASHDNILAVIRKVADVATPGDEVVFYYSGHGAENCIYTFDGSNTPPVMYSELFSELNKCRCRNIIVYIDACHSGTAAAAVKDKNITEDKTEWRNLIKGNDKYVLMLSSRGNEYSGESPLVGAGFFTRSLLKGLHGKCDADNDKKVTVVELFKYIYKDVLLHNKQQHPQLVTSKSLYNYVIMDWN